MEGLNGIKLLDTIYSKEPTGAGLFISVIGAIMFFILILACIRYAFIDKDLMKFLKYSVFLIIVSIFLVIAKERMYELEITHEVTPITKEYSLDLSMYEIIGTKGEIIYIKEKGDN